MKRPQSETSMISSDFHDVDWDSVIRDATVDDLLWLQAKIKRTLENSSIKRILIIKSEE